MTTATETHQQASFMELFLGPTPMWYKQAVIAALVLNVPAYFILGPLVTSWIILFEFILISNESGMYTNFHVSLFNVLPRFSL